MKTVLRVLPCILWMCLIFWLSAQPGEQSKVQSDVPTHKAAEVYETVLGIDADNERHDNIVDTISVCVRKGAHVFMFAVLGGLCVLALGKWYWAAGLSVLYAITDEVHQTFVAGRSGSVTDVLILRKTERKKGQ